MLNDKDCIYKTKKYDVYYASNPVTQGHIIFIPKQDKWQSLRDCFEAAYKWGYDWIDKEYCKSFHILQNVGEDFDGNYVSLIPRQGTGQLDLDKIKDLFTIS